MQQSNAPKTHAPLYRCPQGRGRAERASFPRCRLLTTSLLLAYATSAGAQATNDDIYQALESIFLILYWAGLFVAWAMGFSKGGQR